MLLHDVSAKVCLNLLEVIDVIRSDDSLEEYAFSRLKELLLDHESLGDQGVLYCFVVRPHGVMGNLV